MSRKFRNVTIVFVVSVFIFSLFTGCVMDTTSKNQTTDEKEDVGAQDKQKDDDKKETTAEEELNYAKTGKMPLTKEPIEFTVLRRVDKIMEIDDSWLYKKIEEITGIKLKAEQVLAADFDKKFQLLLASKNLQDILRIGSNAAQNVGPKGPFMPVNKYLDELYYFKDVWAKEDFIRKNLTVSDGNLYYMPRYNASRILNHGMLYRKDIFDKHNIPCPPNGPDEWYSALKKLKELYPESTPYVNKYPIEWFLNYHYTSWGNTDINEHNFIGYDAKEDIYEFTGIQPEFKDMITYFRKLYKEGLVDPELFTLSKDAWTAKMTQKEKAFVAWDWVGRLTAFPEQVKDKIPEYDLKYGYPMGPTGSYGKAGQLGGLGLGVSSSCEHPIIAMQLIDWTYSDEGSKLMTMGIEGETFEETDDGEIIYPEFVKEGKQADYQSVREKYGLYQFGHVFHPECTYLDLPEPIQKATDMIVQSGKIMERESPQLKLTSDEDELINDIGPQMKKALTEYVASVIYGKKDLEGDWDEWVKEAEQIGYKELEKVYRDAHQRYKDLD